MKTQFIQIPSAQLYDALYMQLSSSTDLLDDLICSHILLPIDLGLKLIKLLDQLEEVKELIFDEESLLKSGDACRYPVQSSDVVGQGGIQ